MLEHSLRLNDMSIGVSPIHGVFLLSRPGARSAFPISFQANIEPGNLDNLVRPADGTKRTFRESLFFESHRFFCSRDVCKNNLCYLNSPCAQLAPRLRLSAGNTPCRCGRRSSPWSSVKDRDDSTGT